MRFLFVYYTHKPGGFCLRLYRLMSALVRRGHNVSYLCLDRPPESLDERVHWERIPFPLGRRTGLLFWATFTTWLPVWLMIRCVRSTPDKVVVFGAYYSAVASLAAKVLRIPLVLFLRSLTFEIDRITGKPAWLRRLTGAVDRVGIRAADVVVCMTETMHARVEAFSGKKLSRCHILPNDLPPAPAPASEPPVRQRCTVLTAGVLDPRKNVATLIEALAACDGVDQERLELVIAGQGPEAMSLGRLVHEKGLSNVKLLGWRSDVGELMQSASVLVHPALHEGVANTVLEALARDLPILVSDIPEHREIFSEETVLVSPNSVEAWCRVFQRLSDTAFLDDVRAASRRLASKLRFDWDERASKLVIEA